jgi:hypothetical protein
MASVLMALPADTGVVGRPGRAVAQPDEVHDALAGAERLERRLERGVRVADDQRLGMRDHVFDPTYQQAADVGDRVQ